MFDLRWIRENQDDFDAGLERRGLKPMAAEIAALDGARRAAQTELQEAQTRRNDASKEIGAIKGKGGDAEALMAEVAALKQRLPALEAAEREAGEALDRMIEAIPNLPAADVPVGEDEAANQILREVGDKPDFDFEPRDHVAIGEALGMMDFEAAAKMSGARFVVLSGALARMERALGQFMLDLHTGEFGYTEISPPVLVRDGALFVAELADEWNALGVDVEGYRRKREVLESHCREVGRDPSAIRRSQMSGFIVGKDDRGVRDHLQRIAEKLPHDAVVGSMTAGPDQVFQAARARGWLVGTPSEVVDELGRREEAGITRLMLQHHANDDFDVLDLLASEVLPQVQK